MSDLKTLGIGLLGVVILLAGVGAVGAFAILLPKLFWGLLGVILVTLTAMILGHTWMER